MLFLEHHAVGSEEYYRSWFAERHHLIQVYNARKVNCSCARILCVHIKTSSLWAEFVNKNRCIHVRLVSEDVKSIKLL